MSPISSGSRVPDHTWRLVCVDPSVQTRRVRVEIHVDGLTVEDRIQNLAAKSLVRRVIRQIDREETAASKNQIRIISVCPPTLNGYTEHLRVRNRQRFVRCVQGVDGEGLRPVRVAHGQAIAARQSAATRGCEHARTEVNQQLQPNARTGPTRNE